MPAPDSERWLVVGLGNPGAGYSGNRHNVGQMVLDVLAERVGGVFRTHKTANAVLEGRVRPGAPRLILAKPHSFMNNSGGPVNELLAFYSATPERLVVVHDELDLPFDTLRLKFGGGHGGHNGIRDILAATRGADFARIRLGIGRPPGRQPAADFVLRDFSSTERVTLPNMLTDAADAVELLTEAGLTAAQQRYHSPREV